MKQPTIKTDKPDAQYQSILGDVYRIVDAAGRSATHSVNAVMTAAYWLIRQHIVECKQSGEKRGEFGTVLSERLAADLTQRFGCGFARQNIHQMCLFYVSYSTERIQQTLSGQSKTAIAEVCRESFSQFYGFTTTDRLWKERSKV